MGLAHAVVTAVARDDLPDGGAAAMAETVRAIRRRCPSTTVEVLIPDCKGDPAALAAIFESRPDILNHNLETVARLQRLVRPSASYVRSLAVLGRARAAGLVTKSGLIVGHGRDRGRGAGGHGRPAQRRRRHPHRRASTCGRPPTTCPSPAGGRPTSSPAWPRPVRSLGFAHVEASPLTRSSYHARQAAEAATSSDVSLKSAVLWLRRDLRLADHPALLAALAAADEVVPLFVVDPVLERTGGPAPAGVPGRLPGRPPRAHRRPAGGARGGRRSTSWPRWRGRSTPPRCSSPTTSARTAPAVTRPSRQAAGDRRCAAGPGRLALRRGARRRHHRQPGRRTRSSRRSTGAGGPTGGRRPSPAPSAPRWASGVRSEPLRRLPTSVRRTILPPGEAAALARARASSPTELDVVRRRSRRARRGRHLPPVPVPQVRLPAPSPGAGRRCDARAVPHRAGVAGVLRRRAASSPDSARTSLRPDDGGARGRHRPRRRPPLRRLGRGPDRLPDRRRRHAPAGRRGVDAQPGAHDRRQLPGQGPPPRLAPGRPPVHGPPRRRRPGVQPARLAVGRRHRHRPGAVLPRSSTRRPRASSFDPDGTYVRRWVPELRDVDAAGTSTSRGPCRAARPPATRRRSSTTRSSASTLAASLPR